MRGRWLPRARWSLRMSPSTQSSRGIPPKWCACLAKRNASLRSWEEAVEWVRRQPQHAELVRQCYFDDPLLEAARRFHRSGEWLATRQFIPRSPGKAVDLGAGRGIASYALASDGWRVTAIEPDASAVVGAGAIEG